MKRANWLNVLRARDIMKGKDDKGQRKPEVQESTQNIEGNFSDVMPTAEEFWYDAQPETYEPSCYDGTYSEM